MVKVADSGMPGFSSVMGSSSIPRPAVFGFWDMPMKGDDLHLN